MFEHLRQFKKIIVTGPQRAGTTITAKIIAHDTGHRYIDEAAIAVRDLDKMRHIIKHKKNFVLQCPSMVCHLPKFSNRTDTAIVMVFRPIAEIKRSQKRVNWDIWEESELIKFDLTKGSSTPPISQVKYDFWQEIKATITNPIEVNYRELSGHPLWLPDEKRRHFNARQTV